MSTEGQSVNEQPEFEEQDDAAATAALTAGFEAPNAPTETPGQGGEEGAAPAPRLRQITEDEYTALLADIAESKSLKAQVEKVSGTAFGKIGGIERTLNNLTQAQGVNVSQEAIDSLRADGFDPLADALEALKNVKVLPAQIDPEALEPVVTARLDKAAQAMRQQIKAEVYIEQHHPDWQEIDADPAWQAHVAALPQDRKQALAQASQQWDAKTIAKEMTAFKQAKQAAPGSDPATARRNRLQAAAATPRGTGGDAGSSPEDDFMAGFNSR